MRNTKELRDSIITASSLTIAAIVIYGLKPSSELVTKVIIAIILTFISASFIKNVWNV